jgi:hypothetical protein
LKEEMHEYLSKLRKVQKSEDSEQDGNFLEFCYFFFYVYLFLSGTSRSILSCLPLV